MANYQRQSNGKEKSKESFKDIKVQSILNNFKLLPVKSCIPFKCVLIKTNH